MLGSTLRDKKFGELFADLAKGACMSLRDRRVLEKRYGFNGEKPLTFFQISKQTGLPLQKIKKISRSAIILIRSKMTADMKNIDEDSASQRISSYLKNRFGDTGKKDKRLAGRISRYVKRYFSYLPARYGIENLILLLAYPSFSRHKILIKKVRRLMNKSGKTSPLYLNNKQSLVFRKLLSEVEWFGQSEETNDLSLPDINEISLESKRRIRNVPFDYQKNSGSFYSHKLKREVQFESGREREMFIYMEKHDDVVWYKEQPLKLSYRLQGKDRYVYPDCLFELSSGKRVVVDIRPVFKMALSENVFKWSLMQKYCRRKGYGLLITDGKKSISHFLRHEVNKEFAQAVLDKLRKIRPRSLWWQEYKSLLRKHKAIIEDDVGLILQCRLVWTLNPFSLRGRGLSSYKL
ncbi:hypothetical protein M1271_03040 [Patescibacteria group bacterium]|nr:hypothetical protein [Patescibacteria group bacterium]